MILMIKEDVKIETIGMLKQNVKNNNNGLMLPFANLVFVANKISAQLENEMLENRSEYEKNLIQDEEEARQFIRNNGGQIEEKSFEKKIYSDSIIYSNDNYNKNRNLKSINGEYSHHHMTRNFAKKTDSDLYPMPSPKGDSRRPGFPRQLKCYSCMSLNYQESWDYLQATYEKPHVFTNRCNDQHLMQNMGLVSCNTFCVTLAEPNVEAGVFIGFKYIRGCADRIVKNGFNQTALRTHRFVSTPTCRMLPRALIFNQPKGMDVPVYGDVRLCTCFTDRCNAASNSASIFKMLPLLSKIWFIFLLLISPSVINCFFVL
uniref:Caenorhabditis elegans ly-6-related family-containing protein n=2 Tax=Strongyloides stercoralis TaxID=6248 RepID=A0A913HKI2_STRER